MGIFSKPEHQLSAAILGIEKFVSKFEKAAAAAKKELEEVEINLANTIDKSDTAIERAYDKYMEAEAKYNLISDKALASADERKAILTQVAEAASTTVENFRKMYSSK